MDWGNLALVSACSALALGVVQSVTWLWSRRVGRLAIVDTVWGAGFVVVALVGVLLGSGDPLRRWLMAALAGIWGLRLSWHILRRSRGKGEDPRYEQLGKGKSPAAMAVRVFGLQGLLQWLISWPVQFSAASDATTGPWWLLLGLGVLLWLVGLTFEAVGDAQLAAFKADPTTAGQVMDRGLWSWTRHPNYFGDACLWWGLFLVAASSWAGVLTLLSPIVMTHFLRNVSGAKLLEQSMQDRPGFADYQQRTAYFFPRPPRRHRATT